jgi:GDP/UDP-N,N'-diacetylbacillosamine 2-epimerase (hydrolysing)
MGRKIAVFTSIRSEYGLLSPLLKRLDAHPAFELKVLAGGAHLLSSYGYTINQIKKDGFEIDGVFPFLVADEEKDSLSRSLANLQFQIGAYFSKSTPDLLIVLGDRVELIPVVMAAILCQVPVAHISGGETTEGAIDNQIRHALTKLSHIHFPAMEQYAKNIERMGEESWRVKATGEPGLDLVQEIPLLEEEELFRQLGISKGKPIVIATFHPETINNSITPEFVEKVFLAVLQKGFRILVTASNFDEGGSVLNRLYEKMANENQDIMYIPSLGQLRYYSFLKQAYVMLGNSSSGPVEAQTFGLPVINVGERQKGRIINPNILDVDAQVDAINLALDEIESPAFKNKYVGKPNVYGDGFACSRIIEYLEKVPWDSLFLKKDQF